MPVKRGAPKTRKYTEGSKLSFKGFTRPIDGAHTQFWYRPGTSDDSVMHEILETQWYRRKHLGFDVEQGEHWLDLGANIGVFALLCWLKGATATCYEPQEDNFKILARNLKGFAKADPPSKGLWIADRSAVTHLNQPTVPFFRGRSEADYARYSTDKTIFPLDYKVPNVSIRGLEQTPPWDGIKLDIEGAEHPILDAELLPPCRKLAMEYHIRKYPNMADFRRRMKYLKSLFKVVHYAPSLDKGYPGDKYPGAFDRMVFCLDPK